MGMLIPTFHIMNAKLSLHSGLLFIVHLIVQRQRTQVNGKILEDGNTVHADGAMNGA